MKILATCAGCKAKFSATVKESDALQARSMAKAFAENHIVGESNRHVVTITEPTAIIRPSATK